MAIRSSTRCKSPTCCWTTGCQSETSDMGGDRASLALVRRDGKVEQGVPSAAGGRAGGSRGQLDGLYIFGAGLAFGGQETCHRRGRVEVATRQPLTTHPTQPRRCRTARRFSRAALDRASRPLSSSAAPMSSANPHLWIRASFSA